jgi:diadenosine tetraphosphate (Ap4A) HIT family hydrolase
MAQAFSFPKAIPTLIIPSRHTGSFFNVTDEERQAMLQLLDTAKVALDDEFHPDGYNVGVNDGQAEGQTVLHLHIHLIPRYTGDREDSRRGVCWMFPEKANYWSKR